VKQGNHAGPPAWALRVAGGVALAAIWEAGARSLHSLLLPSFTSTVAALVGLAASAELWGALRVSNETLAVGFAATLLVGVPVGLALGRWPRVDRWIDPYLTILLTLPASALIPLVFIVAGLGLASRAALVCLFSLPVVVECARDGVRQVDPRLRDMAAAFGATSRQQWRKVLLPGAVPGIMTGARLGLARAVEGMIVVEILLVAVGIGGLLLDFQGRFEAGHVYAVVLVVMAEAVVLTGLGRAIERRLVRGRGMDEPR
jgi:ABC-type nitrate/sulfonate/bicarbonate transport system permease component